MIIQSGSSHISINGSSVSITGGSVTNFRSSVATSLHIKPGAVSIYVNGQEIRDGQNLSSYHLCDGAVVSIIQKKESSSKAFPKASDYSGWPF